MEREKICSQIKGRVKILKRYFWKILKDRKKSREEAEGKRDSVSGGLTWENPFLDSGRDVIEEVLRYKNLDYRSFRPILIDTDFPDQHFGEEDDVDQVLSQIERGLNFLEICTDRPEYFESWKNYMEEEYGLIVRLVPKNWQEALHGNMVLDFERNSPMYMEHFPAEMIYLTFQKRRWEILYPDEKNSVPKERKAAETAENKGKPEQDYLDINVPIGYNMLAVKVKKNE